SLQDWKDSNDAYRLNGAESEDTYLELPVPYRARNGPLEATAELLQIKGVTPGLYFGSSDHPGLVEFVTVQGQGRVNINTAPEPVLKALGLSEAEVSDIVQSRLSAPYAGVPPRFTGRGLSAASRTFRVEAAGWVGDEAVAVRVLAIVQRATEGGAGQLGITILSWNPSAAVRR
ncbi:MAG: general secretion pathway protein GspK, partial [Candidatus Methylomirabilia bacterium]